jgi:hypothetical protein
MMERPLRNLKIKRVRNNFLADTFKMELYFRQYIFQHRQAVHFLLGGLFILDFKVKKIINRLTMSSADKKETAPYNIVFIKL